VEAAWRQGFHGLGPWGYRPRSVRTPRSESYRHEDAIMIGFRHRQ
jgi:hypothetical protein